MKHQPFLSDDSRLTDRFGLLTAVSIGSIVLLMLVNTEANERSVLARSLSVVTIMLAALTLLLALRAAGVAHRWQRIADAIVIVTVILVSLVALLESFASVGQLREYPAPILVVALSVLAPIAVIARLVRHRSVTRATVLGAISGYLLIAIMFYYVFLMVGQFTGNDFFGSAQPTQSYMYFSLSTLTTTGYGDLTAKTDLGRLLATSEAVTGQIYLVTFVAMIVGLFVSQRVARRQDAKAGSPSDT